MVSVSLKKKNKQLFIHLKNETFHVHSNNKVFIAVEYREVLLDPNYNNHNNNDNHFINFSNILAEHRHY